MLQLTSQNIEIKLVSDVTADSKVLEALKLKGKAKVDTLLYLWVLHSDAFTFTLNNVEFLYKYVSLNVVISTVKNSLIKAF